MPGPVLSSGDTKVNTTGSSEDNRLLGRSRDGDAETVRMPAGKNASALANTGYSDSKTKNTIPAGQKGVREKK